MRLAFRQPKTVLRLGHGDDVYMIRHQTPNPDAHTMGLALFGQQILIREPLVIAFRSESEKSSDVGGVCKRRHSS